MADKATSQDQNKPAKKAWTGVTPVETSAIVDNTAGVKAEWYGEFNFAGFFLRDFRVS